MNWFQQKCIFVPFDFSEESLEAVKMSLQLAADQSDIHVVHVLPELGATEPSVIWEAVTLDERKAHVRKEIDKKLSQLGAGKVHVDVGMGDPGHVLTDLAEEIGAGLIIIPSHGRTGLKRLLLGSVAERVVRLARCPVLVLKKPRE